MNRFQLEAKIKLKNQQQLGYYLDDMTEEFYEDNIKEQDILDDVRHFCGLDYDDIWELAAAMREPIVDIDQAQTLALTVASALGWDSND